MTSKLLEIWVSCPNLPKGQKDGYHSRCGNWESGPCPCLSGDHPGLVQVPFSEIVERMANQLEKLFTEVSEGLLAMSSGRFQFLPTRDKTVEVAQLLFRAAFGRK